MSNFMTMTETCGALRLSRNTVKKLVLGQQLRGAKVAGKWRFTPDDIAEFLRTCLVTRSN